MFAKPITERDAPGYRSLIYQPQDLKGIRSAISAGSRAVAAAADSAASVEETGSANSKAATFWIERSVDVLPPRAIVNSAQLEMEVCRMFANAVMFNPDPKRAFGPAFRLRSHSKGHGHVEDEAEEGEGTEEHEGLEELDDDDDDDDDGGSFVRDTREMFESVERSLTTFRTVERAIERADENARMVVERREESEGDELAAEGGEGDGGRRSSKRG